MHWQLQPILWPIIIATLALLAMPPRAHPAPPSSQLVALCSADAQRLCPSEVVSGDHDRIGRCMRAHRKAVSKPCRAQVKKEFGVD